MNPLISVCIPSYNGENYIIQCLDSILKQTETNFEIIIVDDCSTDKTSHLLEHYSLKDKRIHFYKNEKNVGLVANWNKCVELSTGEWIKFVFQDDYLEPDCLEQFLSYTKPETQLLVAKRSFILYPEASEAEKKYYSTEVRTLENTNCYTQQTPCISAQVISKAAVQNIALNFIGEPSLTMFRKAVVKTVGLFNKDLQQICDLEYFLRIGSQFGLTYIPKQLCHFRIHKQSATSRNLASKNYILSHLEPVIVVWYLLFHSYYHSFRAQLQPPDFFKLTNFLQIRTYEAWLNSKNGHKELFEKIVQKFPELRPYAQSSTVIRMKYLLILLRRKLRKISS